MPQACRNGTLTNASHEWNGTRTGTRTGLNYIVGSHYIVGEHASRNKKYIDERNQDKESNMREHCGAGNLVGTVNRNDKAVVHRGSDSVSNRSQS